MAGLPPNVNSQRIVGRESFSGRFNPFKSLGGISVNLNISDCSVCYDLPDSNEIDSFRRNILAKDFMADGIKWFIEDLFKKKKKTALVKKKITDLFSVHW